MSQAVTGRDLLGTLDIADCQVTTVGCEAVRAVVPFAVLRKPVREFGIAFENLFNLLGRYVVTGNVGDIFVIPIEPAQGLSIYTLHTSCKQPAWWAHRFILEKLMPKLQ